MSMSDPGHATVARRVGAATDIVFNAWTTPRMMERWWAERVSIDPRSGGRFRLETRVDDRENVVTGTYREFVPGQRLVMTWHQSSEGEATAESVVTVEFRELDQSTDVRVTEEPVDAADQADAKAAWNGALDALEAFLIKPGS
jgi:uncharacterized protein YndB with AHSA1/START domain